MLEKKIKTLEDVYQSYEDVYKHPVYGPTQVRNARLHGLIYMGLSLFLESINYYFLDKGPLTFDLDKMEFMDIIPTFIFLEGTAELVKGRLHYISFNGIRYSARLINYIKNQKLFISLSKNPNTNDRN